MHGNYDMPVNLPSGSNLFSPGDWLSCNAVYGTDLDLEDCMEAARQLPSGEDLVQFGPGQGRFVLPIQKHCGGCYLTIESSGGRPGAYNNAWAVPSAFRTVSFTLIEECVHRRAGQGGFQTYVFSHAVDWSQVDAMADGGWLHPPPVSATFFTITISESNRKFNPGNFDPGVPLRFANAPATAATMKNPNAPDAHTRSQFWLEQRARMQSGGSTSWWQYQPNQLSDEMEYRCDIDLGSPSVNDCNHIQWDQLDPPSDSVTISSGGVKFFHYNTCYLAIYAAISIVLSWEQISAAIGSLIGICAQKPSQTVQGGKVYHQSSLQSVSDRSAIQRKRQNFHATGLNALPPGVNLTMFEQKEAWTSPTEELNLCTWKAVLDGGPVSACSA